MITRITAGGISNQVIARHTATFDGTAQLVERFDLDLAHALPSQLKVFGHLFKRADLTTAQTITTLKHPSQLIRQLLDPVLDQGAHLIRLQQALRINRIVVRDGISDRMTGVDFQRCI